MSPLEHFARPELGWLLPVVPVAGVLLYVLDRWRVRRTHRCVGLRAARLTRSLDRSRRRLGRLVFLAAMTFAVIAAMQPRWGRSAGSHVPGGIDIVVALDVSRSMLARDVLPSRLVRAKREIRALAGRAEDDRLALVVFSGEARVLVPLTRDRRSFLELADPADPLSVARGGTDLGAALLTALAALPRQSERHQAIVLLTDGDDLEGRGLSVAKTCRERGIAVHTVGLGSARGAKIPIRSEGGETYLRDRSGEEVVSRLDVASLRAIADTTGGQFLTTEESARPLARLYTEGMKPRARQAFLGQERRERENRFQWPLLLALVLLITDPLICEKRSS
jgi:Ca-activated chloride channel family protein